MSRFKLFFSSIWAFLQPFIEQFFKAAGPVLLKAATQAVAIAAQNMTGATGSEKRDQAYRMIVKDLETQGIKVGVDVGTSMINSAIEIAVQKLKAGQA